jgi:hypothetical protein
MIPNPFKKGYKIQNRISAMKFLIDYVFLFDTVITIEPNLLLVNERIYQVHAYCDSTKAMVLAPNGTPQTIDREGWSVLLVRKPEKENRIIVYEIADPEKLVEATRQTKSCSLEWEQVRKITSRTFIVNLETGVKHEYMSKL